MPYLTPNDAQLAAQALSRLADDAGSDKQLRDLAEKLDRQAGERELAFRWGGDELAGIADQWLKHIEDTLGQDGNELLDEFRDPEPESKQPARRRGGRDRGPGM